MRRPRVSLSRTSWSASVPSGSLAHRGKESANKELRELIEATGTSLLTLNGIGPSGAARLLIDTSGGTLAHEVTPDVWPALHLDDALGAEMTALLVRGLPVTTSTSPRCSSTLSAATA